MAAVVRANPFSELESTKVTVAFFAEDVTGGAFAALKAAVISPEQLVPAPRELYLYLPNGAGRSKLVQVLGSLRVPVTARNWRTVNRLVELVS